MSIKDIVKAALTKRNENKYNELLKNSRIDYPAWAEGREGKFQISDNDSLSGWCIYVSNKGHVSDIMLPAIKEAIENAPDAKIIYGDEDVLCDGIRKRPFFKPDWSPDKFDSWFYPGAVIAVSESVAKESGLKIIDLNEEFFEKIRSYLLVAGAFKKGSKAVAHVPYVLFHNDKEDFEKAYIYPSKEEAFGKAFPMVSIIIPSKDNPLLLEKCIERAREAFKDIENEIIVVDNGSNGMNKLQLNKMSAELKFEYIYMSMDFNFAKMCNIGADMAKGSVLLFLNDDVELVKQSPVEKMTMMALREYTGAVGLKLYYPDSVKIQHAGITNLPMGPVHKCQFLEDTKEYYFGENRGLKNVTAVTAACLMIEKRKFIEAGGFCEDLKVAFNDVDLCFSLCDKGYFNVCVNDGYAYHHESLTRGNDESADKVARLFKERDLLYKRHEKLRGADPFFSECLSRGELDTGIRYAYETVGNCTVPVEDTDLKHVQKQFLNSCRQDECLHFRVESVDRRTVKGYTIVLGDNNANYAFEIVFKGENNIYTFPMEGRYRPDIADNMPDQINVGLCGFNFRFSRGAMEKLKKEKTYNIGIMAKNTVTKTGLINFSTRYFNP
ncbi:MAG: glycosyltransferase [Acetatifactor sp.]|nr:glycosyltransferase [Acetatifactor sp.]